MELEYVVVPRMQYYSTRVLHLYLYRLVSSNFYFLFSYSDVPWPLTNQINTFSSY